MADRCDSRKPRVIFCLSRLKEVWSLMLFSKQSSASNHALGFPGWHKMTAISRIEIPNHPTMDTHSGDCKWRMNCSIYRCPRGHIQGFEDSLENRNIKLTCSIPRNCFEYRISDLPCVLQRADSTNLRWSLISRAGKVLVDIFCCS